MCIPRCIRDRGILIQGLDNMKKICKLSLLIQDNRGETIVEVVVAFTLLSIMLVILSQGITSASKAMINANDHRESADKAMIQLQQKDLDVGAPQPVAANTNIYRHVITISENGRLYRYVVYTSSATVSGNNT